MRNRTYTCFLIGLMISVALVCVATSVAAGRVNSSETWLHAQSQNPLLWMVDGCAIIIFLGFCLFGVSSSGQAVPEQTERELESLRNTVEELYRQTNRNAVRVEALEESGDAWHEGFDQEASRLTEQAFLALSDNIESNAQQLEAVMMALRYQRAEMRAIRGAFKTGEIALEAGDPPSLEAVDRPAKAILPPRREAEPVVESPDDDAALDAADSDPGPADVTAAADGEAADAEEAEVTGAEDVEVADAEDAEDTAAESPESLFAESGSEQLGDGPGHPDTGVQTSAESTANADSTQVELVELTVHSSGEAVVVSPDGEPQDIDRSAESRAMRAADEFRRGKEEARSIFRQKRP